MSIFDHARSFLDWEDGCILFEIAGKDTCNGDSGGPIVHETTQRVYYQVGIVSFGWSKDCGSGKPAIYTRISKFSKWIEDSLEP